MQLQRSIEESSCNHGCHTKTMSITYFEGVFAALGTQHAMRMRSIILPYVTRPDVQNFSTLSHKRHDFRKKILNIKCVLIYCTTFV